MVTQAGDNWIEAEGGHARSVIELAGTGPEAEPPTFVTEHTVTGSRFLIGHTRDLADPGEPVIVREADISSPPASGLAYAEGRCPSCTARVTIGSIGDGDVLMVLEHQEGCRAFGRLLAKAAQQ
jgi:hypothetical protein